VVTSTLVFEGGAQVNEYVGGYSDWLRQRKVAAPVRAPVAPGKSASVPPAAVSPSLKTRRLSHKDQQELAAMPEKISRLEAEQLQLQAAIADPSLFQGNSERGKAALQRLQSLAEELEHAYARWDALESSPGAVPPGAHG